MVAGSNQDPENISFVFVLCVCVLCVCVCVCVCTCVDVCVCVQLIYMYIRCSRLYHTCCIVACVSTTACDICMVT